MEKPFFNSSMGRWKDHVHSRLQWRDHIEKLPFIGVFTSLSQMEERFEIFQQILADQSKGSETREVGMNTLLLQFKLKESEHLAEKLSQTISNLTAAQNLKEAELQYWQSCVSKYRREALTLAKGNNSLKATLSEFEFTVECQAKELSALRVERGSLKEAVEKAEAEKERLLQRLIKEKSEEAARLNTYNYTEERWQRLAKWMKKHLKRKTRKEFVPTVTSTTSDVKEMFQSAIQGSIINQMDDRNPQTEMMPQL